MGNIHNNTQGLQHFFQNAWATDADITTKTGGNAYFLFYALIIVAAAVLGLYFHTMDPERASSMLHESGVVECLSAAGYFVCFLAILAMGKLEYLRKHFPLVLFPVLFGLRELDFDKRFVETGLLQSRIFTSGDVLLEERVLGVVVMVLLMALIVFTLRRYLKPFFRHLLTLDVVAVGVSVALACMAISKSMDGLGRKLEPLGITVSSHMTFSASVWEEVIELCIPAILLVAAVAYFRRRAAVEAAPRSPEDL